MNLYELCNTTRPVFLDGSGSTEGFWKTKTWERLRVARLFANRPTFWCGYGSEVVSLRTRQTPDFGGTDFRNAVARLARNFPGQRGILVTDEREMARQMLGTAERDFQIVIYKELEEDMRCRCSGIGCLCSLVDDIRELEIQVDGVLTDSDNNQARNKRAFELHSKLVRVVKEVDKLDQSKPEVKLLRRRVMVMLDRLLVEVFQIDPDKTRDQTSEIHADVEPIFHAKTPGLVLTTTEAFGNDNVAGVKLQLTWDGGQAEFEGSAKRNPADRPDRDTGLTVAFADALRKAARHIEHEANGRIAAGDKARRQAEQAKAQRRADARKLQSKARARQTQKQLQDEIARLRVDLEQAQSGAQKLAAVRKAAVKKAPAKKKS